MAGMDLVLYGVVKFVAYSLWGCYGFRLYSAKGPLLAKGLRFGMVRWAIGLILGIVVFFLAGSIDQAQALFDYMAIYIPVRIFEWTLMSVLFFPDWNKKWARLSLYYWIVAGVALSFLTDFVSPQMVGEGGSASAVASARPALQHVVLAGS
jgi:hypothetical protein